MTKKLGEADWRRRFVSRKPKPFEAAEPCHCGAAVGEKHQPGCDMEQCPLCGLQASGCATHYYPNDDRIAHDGYPRGTADAIRFGLYTRLTGNGWEACGRDDEGAWPDLNTLFATCRWDPQTKQFKPSHFGTFEDYVRAFPNGERSRAWVTHGGQRHVACCSTTATTLRCHSRLMTSRAVRRCLTNCVSWPYESLADFMSLGFTTE